MKTEVRFLLLAVSCLTGCAGLYAIATFHPKDSVGFAKGDDRTIRHRISGIEFPQAVGDFVRKSASVHDSEGHDVSVIYSLSELGCSMSVSVYPIYGDLKKHARMISSGIENENPSAIRISNSETRRVDGENAYSGVSLTHRYEETHEGRTRIVLSLVQVFAYEDWFILFRMIYSERPNDVLGPEELTAFVEQLPWS